MITDETRKLIELTKIIPLFLKAKKLVVYFCNVIIDLDTVASNRKLKLPDYVASQMQKAKEISSAMPYYRLPVDSIEPYLNNPDIWLERVKANISYLIFWLNEYVEIFTELYDFIFENDLPTPPSLDEKIEEALRILDEWITKYGLPPHLQHHECNTQRRNRTCVDDVDLID